MVVDDIDASVSRLLLSEKVRKRLSEGQEHLNSEDPSSLSQFDDRAHQEMWEAKLIHFCGTFLDAPSFVVDRTFLNTLADDFGIWSAALDDFISKRISMPFPKTRIVVSAGDKSYVVYVLLSDSGDLSYTIAGKSASGVGLGMGFCTLETDAEAGDYNLYTWWNRRAYTWEDIEIGVAVFLKQIMAFMFALSQKQTIVETIAPSKKFNRRRVARGDRPFVEYKIIKVRKGHKYGAPVSSGSRASPKFHIRRGHTRHLQNKDILIPAHYVGDLSLGVVNKRYLVSE